MSWSAERNELATALAIAQGQIKAAKRGNKAGKGSFTYQYSSLEDIWDVARKPLSENGLSVVQIPSNDENGFYVETIILHTSGQWVSSDPMRLPEEAGRMSALQALGSSITYARRYQLAAMVGISNSTEDDDGQAGSQGHNGRAKVRRQPNNAQRPVAQSDGNGHKDEAFDTFLAKTRIELNLSEDQTKAILKELGNSGFTPDKADEYFQALDQQLVNPTTETALLVLANREA